MFFEKGFPQFIKTFDGEKIFVLTNFDPEVKSDEPTLIFNYGLVCNFAHFENQIPFFHKKGYRILLHDYRGHYQSSGADKIKNITFENLNKDLKVICEKLNLHKVFIIGHSMGVNTALDYARSYPNDVKGLVLIAGTVFPPHDVMFAGQGMNFVFPLIKNLQKTFPDIYKFIWSTGGLNPLARYLVHRGGFNVKQTSKEFIEVYLNRLGKLDPQIFIRLLEEMRDHDIITHLDEISMPTLVIAGDHDQVIPYDIQKVVHRQIPHSELFTVKEGSHVPQVDFPDKINKRIEKFLNEISNQ